MNGASNVSQSEFLCEHCALPFDTDRKRKNHIEKEHSGSLPNIQGVLDDRRTQRARLALLDLLEVPPISFYKNYVQRTLPGGVFDIPVLERCATLQKWTLIYGPTGSGKTLAIMAVSAKMKRRYASINFHNGIKSGDLIGRWVPKNPDMPSIEELLDKFKGDSNLVNAYIHKYRHNFKWVDGRLTDFYRNGGILDLAEINMAPPAVTSFLFQMLDIRRQIVLEDKDGEVVHAHPEFWVAVNYNEDYIGCEELNQALLSRFPVKFFWGYDDGVERKLVKDRTVAEIGKRLRESGEVSKDVGTRDLMDFCDNIKVFGTDLACEMFSSGFDSTERKPVGEIIRMEFSRARAAEQEAAKKTEEAKKTTEGVPPVFSDPAKAVASPVTSVTTSTPKTGSTTYDTNPPY
jgi:nitric oxide reductase NorQ protein